MDCGVFISVVRLGIGHVPLQEVTLSKKDIVAIKALAEEQGLDAVVLDGLKKLPVTSLNMSDLFMFQWTGEIIAYYEERFKAYVRAIAELARFYNDHNFKMMVLKGYACSLDWPKPEHRPIGDIDIWLFGKQRSADDVLEREIGVKVDSSEHRHTVFYWRSFMVENHYDFINVHHHKSNAELEKVLKDLGRDDSHYVKLNGEKVYFPSSNLHALFLLRHAMTHFAVTGISLKHLLDWAFHVKAHGTEIDWTWLTGVLEVYGMTELFHIFNAICIEDLGFEPALFPSVDYNQKVKGRVLQEILAPAIPNEEPEQWLKRVGWKIHRWKANEWKHRLCYNDSIWSAFWSGVWSHLLKPSSI